MLKSGALLALILIANPAQAAKGPPSTFDAFFSVVDLETSGPPPNVEGDGESFGVRGRFVSPSGLFGSLLFETSSLDLTPAGATTEVDLDEFRAGVGFLVPVGPAIHAFAQVDGIANEFTFKPVGTRDSDDGFGVYAGIEASVASNINAYGRVGYMKLADDDGPDLTAGARLLATRNFGIFGEARYYDLEDDFSTSSRIVQFRIGAGFGF